MCDVFERVRVRADRVVVGRIYDARDSKHARFDPKIPIIRYLKFNIVNTYIFKNVNIVVFKKIKEIGFLYGYNFFKSFEPEN